MATLTANPNLPQHVIIDLNAEVTKVSAMGHGPTGRITHPVASVAGLRAVLVSMKAGAQWPQHATPGRITVQPLAGRIGMRWQNQEAVLESGTLFVLASNVPHDVIAETDAVFLLTVARPSAD